MPPADYKTFRMRGIPAGTTPEKLQTLVAEAVSCKDASAVRVRSLAVDASRPREMVATVTFESIPEKLLDECGDWTIEAPRDITLVIDTHFHGCTTLHCPPADQWKSDLIAISGLNGHAFGSFKKKNSSYMWLCDSLPKDFPGCRIIIYGYDTRLQDSRSFQSLLDIGKKFQTAIRQVRQNARKPLIFLGHSLGGIVAKEAISLMQESSIDADRLTFRAIRGIIFFGVPNQGMDIRSLIPMVGDQANRGFLHTLDHNSPVLRTQARDFSAAISHIRCEILNFYETQESPTAHQNEDGTWSMSGPPAVLVDTHSATHGRPDDSQGHRVSPIDCDHSNLIKFGSAYDEPYGTVTSFLQEISSHKAAQKVPMIKTEQACYQSLGFCEQYHRMDSLEPSPGTCDWLIAHELFIEWLQSSKGLLWIRGKPGSGKSMVMKHALNHIKDSTSGIVASFFIHGQGTQLQKTILGIYRSLMHQLFPYSPESFSSLTAKFEEYSGQAGPGAQDEKWSWMEGEIRHHFCEGLQKLCRKSRVVVFVDALDEAGEQQARAIFKDFDTLIGSLGDDSTCQLSLCIACRHYPDISFKSAKTIIMEKFNSLDIKHVVNSRLDSEDIFEDSEKRHLKAEILEKSEGIFQWTSLVTETVILMRQKGDSFQAAKRNLDRVPRGLDHLYKAVLEPTDEHEHELKQRTKLFQWVALAAEPLTPLMLQHALALHSEMTYTLVREYQQSDGFVAEQDFETRIKTLSKGLIQLKGSFKNGRIEFIHQSIRDFLLGHGGLDTLSRLSGSASIELGHFEMSMSCLKYLFMDEIRHLITQSNPNPRVSKDGDWVARLPIIAYAWRNWIFHAVSSNELESDRDKGLLTARILDIFCWPDDQPIIELWNPVERIFGSTLSSWNRQFRPFLSLGSILEIPQWPCKNAKLVHLLALTGLLEESTQRTMSSDLEFLATPYPDALVTPLAYALHGQQKRTVQNLISAGIHVQYNTGRCGRSPLYLASLWGDPVIVSLLLDSGAKVNRRESRSWTALHAAAFIGNVAAVNILISAGAKVNYQAKSLTVNGRLHRGSPLHLAVSNGHHETVRKLISHGADLNLRCLGTKEPPLFSAIQRKSVDTIKLLLELGADIHIRDSMGNSPLHYALRYSHPLYYDMNPDPLLDIAALLIQFGCDVNTPDPGGITPLYESLSEGSIKLWDLLLGHGADPNARTPLGLTPLHVAVRCSTEATQALLHAGADVNVESRVLKKFMGFPIHLAVLSGNSTRVQLLLQAGSNVNIRNCERETPLRLALRSSSHDRVKVIKLLLDAGIDPKIVRSEIHATYSMPNVLGRLQLLLLAGMDPNIRDDEGETVLFWIVRSQKLARRKKEWEKREGVKMLLGCGADPSITNQIGRTAFTYAAMNGDYQVAKSLLRSGGPIGVWRQHSRFSFVRRKVDMLAGKSNRFFKRDRSWIPGAAEELVDLFEDMFDEEYYVWKRGVKFKLSTRVVYPSRTLLRTLSVKPKKLKHY